MTPIKNHERDEEGEGGFKLINIIREMGGGKGGSKTAIKNHERYGDGEGGSKPPIKNHERDVEGDGGLKQR